MLLTQFSMPQTMVVFQRSLCTVGWPCSHELQPCGHTRRTNCHQMVWPRSSELVECEHERPEIYLATTVAGSFLVRMSTASSTISSRTCRAGLISWISPDTCPASPPT